MQSHFNNYRYFKKGYGEFPYIIIKTGHAIFMQIPIHFLKKGEEIDIKKHPGTHLRNVSVDVFEQPRESQIFLLHEEILNTTEFVLNKIKATKPEKKLEACLVLGKKQALYYYNGRFTPNTYIPTGGTLIDQTNKIIGMNVEHYWPYRLTRAVNNEK